MKIGAHEIYKMYLHRIKKVVAALGSPGGQVRKVLNASEKAAIESINIASRPNKDNLKIQKEVERKIAEPIKKLDIY